MSHNKTTIAAKKKKRTIYGHAGEKEQRGEGEIGIERKHTKLSLISTSRFLFVHVEDFRQMDGIENFWKSNSKLYKIRPCD